MARFPASNTSILPSTRVLWIQQTGISTSRLLDVLLQLEDIQFHATTFSHIPKDNHAYFMDCYDVLILELLSAAEEPDMLQHITLLKRYMPIVILTDSDEVGVQALREGASDYLIVHDLDSRYLQRTLRNAIERSRADHAAPEREDHLRCLVERSADGIVLIDQDGCIIEWNQALENITGIPHEVALGGYLWDVLLQVTPEDYRTIEVRNQLKHTLRHVLRTGEGDWLGLLPDHLIKPVIGQHRFVQENVFAVRTSCGFMLGAVIRDVTQQKQSQAQLLKLSQVVQQSPVSTVITDPNGKIEYVNAQFTRLTGYTTEEVIGQDSRFFQGEQPFRTEYAQLREAVAREGRWQGEFLNQKKNGELYWESTIVSGIKDETGKIVHYVISQEDITGRKRAEEALRIGEARFRSLFVNHTAVMLLIETETGQIVDANPAACLYYGYSRSEIIHLNIADINTLSPEQVAQERRRLAAQTRDRVEFRHRLANGEIRDVDVFTSVLEMGGRKFFYSIIHDATDRKQAEALLKAERNLLRTLIDNLPDIIYVKDTKSRFVLGNLALENSLVEGTLDSILGKTDFDFHDIELATKFFADEQHVINSGQPLIRIEEYYIDKRTNQQVWVQTTKAPLKDHDGQIVGIVGIGHDISHRKQMEQSLREAERFARSTVDALSSEIAILDENGVIIAVNAAWREFARNNGAREEGVCEGANYLDVLNVSGSGEDAVIAAKFRGGLLAVRQGQLPVFEVEYPCHSPEEKRWFIGRITRFTGDGPLRIVVSHTDITERKLFEEALRQNQAKLKAIVEHSPALISIKDLQGNILLANRQYAVLEAPHFHESIGKNIFELFPKEAAQEIWNRDQAALLANKPVESEVTLPHLDGTSHTYLTVKFPLYNEGDEQPFGTGSISTDITERKWIERELEKAFDQLTLLNRIISLTSSSLETETVLKIACSELAHALNVPQVGAALLDDEGKALQIVAEFNRSNGRPSALGLKFPMNDNPVMDYLERYKVPLAIEDVQQDPRISAKEILFQFGIVSLLAVPLIVNSRLIGWIGIASTEPRRYEEDEIVLAASVAHAVNQSLENSLLHLNVATQNLKLEDLVAERTAQLQRLNERMATILNNTADAIILIRADGTIETTNPAFDQMFGYQRDEVFGRSIAILTDSTQSEQLVEAAHQVRKNKTSYHLQIAAQGKDGTSFDGDFALAFVPDNSEHLVCSIRDITHFIEVERMKDNFISMVSHELRTPTTTILLSANSLKNYYSRMSEEQRQQTIDRLKGQAVVLSELVEAILDLSRVDSRQAVPGSDTVNMQEIVQKVSQEFQVDAGSKQCVLETDVIEPGGIVRGDAIDFERIWRNLVGNAVKYTPPGGRITLRLGEVRIDSQTEQILSPNLSPSSLSLPTNLPNGAYLIGQVEDTGYGIPLQDQSQLFSRFFRGWAGQSNIPGTGLGLPLVHELLDLYKGGICVVSEVNVGSIFTFWLPIQRSDLP